MNGLAFIAMITLLLGMLFFFSAVNNETVSDYARQVLKVGK